MSADEIFAEMEARGFCTAAQAAEAGHPVTRAGRERRRIHWANSSDPDVRAAFEAGRMQGYLEADADLVDGLAKMLGGPGAKSYRHGAHLHKKDAEKAELRARSDAGDMELLEAWRREEDLLAKRQARRDRDILDAGRRYEPIRDMRVWRDYCDESTWERIRSEYVSAGWADPGSEPSLAYRAAA